MDVVYGSKRFDDGTFENINEVELKKIPYCYEVLPLLNELHKSYGHIHPQKFNKILRQRNFYMQGLDIITEQFCKECPECYAKFFSESIIKSTKIPY